MQLEGRVKKVFEVQKGTSKKTGSEWRKQEFIFGYYEDPSSIYESNILLSLMNNRIDEYKIQEGDKIRVRIGLNCREYEGQIFNQINTGTIEIISRQQPQQQPAAAPQQQQAIATSGDPSVTGPQVEQPAEGNDLPF